MCEFSAKCGRKSSVAVPEQYLKSSYKISKSYWKRPASGTTLKEQRSKSTREQNLREDQLSVAGEMPV